jgi:hypothetical protein
MSATRTVQPLAANIDNPIKINFFISNTTS